MMIDLEVQPKDKEEEFKDILGDGIEELIETDAFLWVFDRMPKKMRMVIDLRMSGYTIKEIGVLLKIETTTVYKHIRLAKKRILRGNNEL